MEPLYLFNLCSKAIISIFVSQALEQNLDSLALTSFGVMDTTLEEVFLKVSEEDQSLENSDAGEGLGEADLCSVKCPVLNKL